MHAEFIRCSTLVSHRHVFDFITQCSPVVGLQFCILDSLLGPVLVQATDVILRLLEEDQLVANTLLDENAAGMLVNNRLLVLSTVSKWPRWTHALYSQLLRLAPASPAHQA